MWSLYEKEKFLKPLCFSNGKNQEDIAKEVVSEIKKGRKIIFIKGICGTGKSAIALNIAKELGKTSVVVPGKTLQAQYKKDYEGDKYVLKDNKEKLKISVITGRKNHPCKFLQDQKDFIPTIKKEVNSRLYDIFEGKKEDAEKELARDDSADNKHLPCKIEIKEKNWNRIRSYIQKNKHVDIKNFREIKDVKRASIATICPYWSPVMPSKYELKGGAFKDAKIAEYSGLKNTKFSFYHRKEGCPFYAQFKSYIDSDVLVFNSLKYKLETVMNRKPLTEIEVIDECDEFLDSLANQRTINLDRLINSLIYVSNIEAEEKIKEISEILYHVKNDKKINNAVFSGEIIPLKSTGLYDVLKILLKSPELFDDLDEENYLFDVEETSRFFEAFMNETFITASKKDKGLILSLVSVNLEKKLKEILDKNKSIVLMSGTIHSPEVLNEIFGIEDFKIIEAETQDQGRIKIKRTGFEKNFKYDNFSNGSSSRSDYLLALEKCLDEAERPVLVHVNSFTDLPSKKEIDELELKNIIERDVLKEQQELDKIGEEVRKFKRGEIDILFSTKVSRGMDFPGDQCRSIVFTKYPNPNVKDAFWKILNKTRPQHYWNFYKDKAKRELWQRVYRGLRFREDEVWVLSPDERVLEFFEKNGK